MIAMAPAQHRPVQAVKRFIRSPKGYLLVALALLTVVGAQAEGVALVEPGIVGAVVAAALTDVILIRLRTGGWEFPSGAILTGLIVALVLAPQEPVNVPIATAVLAVASKYLFRTRWSNVFNPAAVALIVAATVFGSGESWWGGLADLPVPLILLLLATGLVVADHVNKLPMVLVFLGSYVALFAASAFLGDPARVAEIFRPPDVNAALFFAFFMLDDPPTCPVRYPDQIWFGLIVAVVSFAVFSTIGTDYYLLVGLLVGNAWETLRRLEQRPKA
ncbi:MAG TPA: RnfABCDGE type electron transport complex subunit D [Chloroflexota bacterium]|nr:RnfABCDGE type electron transport complex subunit D [Chloroflexota bacterium]